ncbi:MATE family efflux transporter [Spiroplasma sp. DGKH1]|uniref:MATE family efflux transporter n=1 Tax=Spiroplasma sp. DGKH1 TaxID=3050074 RepID=UPI0034C5FB32
MSLIMTKNEQKFRYAKPWIAILYFCLPTVLIMVIQGAYNIIDKELALAYATPDLMYDPWYVNQYNIINHLYGVEAVTMIPYNEMRSFINVATQYSMQVNNLILAFSIMIGLGCAMNFSIAYGQRNNQKMKEIAGNGFATTTIFSIMVAFVIFCIIFPQWHAILITSQMGSYYNPITEQLCWSYLYPLLLSTPLMFLSYWFLSMLRSEGKMNWVMMSIVTSVLINCAGSIFFMKVCHLEMVGSMLGTVLSYFVQFGWGIILIFCFKHSNARFNKHDLFFIKWNNVANFMKAGLPNFIISLSFMLTSYVATSLAVLLPNQKYENNIAILQQLIAAINPWITFIISVGFGLTQGARSIIAYNYGAKKYNRIWQVLKRVSLVLIIWFCLIFILIMIFAGDMIKLFAFPAQDAGQYHWWVVIYFMAYPTCSLTFICLTFFQGINKSMMATFTNSLRSVVIALPCLAIGYGISIATGNPIWFFILIGLTDFICAGILIPILWYYWRKYHHQLIDTPDNFNLEDVVFVKKVTNV